MVVRESYFFVSLDSEAVCIFAVHLRSDSFKHIVIATGLSNNLISMIACLQDV